MQRFRELNVWRRGDERAPHKPLKVLYALGRLQAGADRLIPFDELEGPLESLLEEFGPPRKSQHPELPFYHLQTDGVWEVDERVPLTRRRGSQNLLRTDLREWHIGGGFTEPIFEELRRRPEAARELAREILAAHFPESLHASILNAVGLELNSTTRSIRRDSEFRNSGPPWHHLNIRDEVRTHRIGDEVRELLFRCKNVGHAADVLRSVLHANDDSAAGGVRKRNQGLENALRG